MHPNVYPSNIDARNSVWNDVKGNQYNTTINQVTHQTSWGEIAFNLKSLSIFQMGFLFFSLHVALAIIRETFRFVLDALILIYLIIQFQFLLVTVVLVLCLVHFL